MILVHKVDGQWQRLGSKPLTMTRMMTTREVRYADGRIEEEACDPYPVEETIDPRKLERLVIDGVWTAADLAAYGIKIAVPFALPGGKVATGDVYFVESGNDVLEQYNVVDEPPLPPPPEPLTTDQKVDAMLTGYGLSRNDLVTALMPDIKNGLAQ